MQTTSEGDDVRIGVPVCDMHEKPDDGSSLVSQLLYGESGVLLEMHEQYALVRNNRDQYEGYVNLAMLDQSDIVQKPGHFVNQRATLLFATEDIKQPARARLVFGSQVFLHNSDDLNSSWQKLVETADGLYVWRDHLSDLNSIVNSDPVDFATRYCLGAPYLWGGRTPDGFDCSGLVQMACFASGLNLPRDSHQQEVALQDQVSFEARQRGDIVFWPGHVGFLTGPDHLLHATAHSLISLIEPLEAVCDRAGAVSSIRRPVYS